MMMTPSKLTFLIVLLLVSFMIAPSTSTPSESTTKPIDKKVDVIVEGMVYCQSCDKQGSWSLTGANPIAAATISVICKNHRNRVSYYKAFETNANGYFYAQLEGFKMSHNLLDHPLQSCHVRLVSSPLESCNILTNVNYGLNGSPLRYENKRLSGNEYYERVIFAAGPLAFRPAQCTPNAEH